MKIYFHHMSLKEKLDEVQAMYTKISLLLNALPNEDSVPIQGELDISEVEDNLQEMKNQYKQLLSNTEAMYKQLDTFQSALLDRLSVQQLLNSQHSYIPVLSALIDIISEYDDHTDIEWVRRWLKYPQLNLDEASSFFIYATRAAAEALAFNCHVLTGQWEHIVLDLIPLFETFYKMWDKLSISMTFKQTDDNFGFHSNDFNIWIIQVVEDPEMCPNSIIRLKMLFYYKSLKIDDDNYEQALMSVFSAFTSLNINQENITDALTEEIQTCLSLLNHNLTSNYMYQFGQQLAEKLQHHRNNRKQILIQDVSFDYAMGLKKAALPREILGLIAILKYISGQTDKHYDVFQEDPNNITHIEKIDEALNILDTIICNFKTALEEPELLNVTAECVMNMFEKAILSKYMHFQNDIEEEDLDEDIWDSQALYDSIMSVHLIFTELAVNSDQDDTRPGPVGQEIIRMYKERICRLRLQIPKKFIEASEQLCKVIYNDEY